MEIRYRLESMAETEFKINYEFDYSALNHDKVEIQVGHNLKPLEDSDRLIVKAKASLIYSENGTLLATDTVMMTFGLAPIKEIISEDAEGKLICKNTRIIDTFLISAIGALRGVMMKNLKGTPLEKFFIPLIPIEELKSK